MMRYDEPANNPVVSAKVGWMDIMCVSSAGEQTLKIDADRPRARELFQSLEVYLIRSGYEAIVSAFPENLPVTRSRADRVDNP